MRGKNEEIKHCTTDAAAAAAAVAAAAPAVSFSAVG